MATKNDSGKTRGAKVGTQKQTLQKQNNQLRQRVKQLEVECGRYREILRTWMTSRYTAEDLRRITADEDEATFQPLEQFVGELEAIVKGKRRRGA
jgi:hypothetical protein